MLRQITPKTVSMKMLWSKENFNKLKMSNYRKTSKHFLNLKNQKDE